MESYIVHKGNHYEVYLDGNFVCSADTMTEAVKELEACLAALREAEADW